MIIKLKTTKPQGVSDARLAGFIIDALALWGGRYDPRFKKLNIGYVEIKGTQYVDEREEEETP